MNTDIVAYYKQRVIEYEEVYQKPERQQELLQATALLQKIFSGKLVFELACGTGYWTERIAATAKAVLATDINEAVLEVAQTKTYKNANVTFEQADIFQLKDTALKCNHLFGGFIWSHIQLQDLDKFIGITNNFIEPGGTIVLMDNNHVEGSNLPISHQDDLGNTYQLRRLKDGTEHLILKNFPTEEFIRQCLAGKATEINFIKMTYFWLLSYKPSIEED